MRSFANIIATLLLLVVLALAQAQDTTTQLTTHYSTRTVYRVVTETMTGSAPVQTVGTIIAPHPTNATGIFPTHGTPIVSAPAATGTDGTGAAAGLHIPAGAAAAIFLGMLAL